MNPGQAQFATFILDRVQDGKLEEAKALLKESFAKQDAGSFDKESLGQINDMILSVLKPEHVEEVSAILQQFGSQHISK